MFSVHVSRFKYRIDGSDALPEVVVRLDIGLWYATVLIRENGSSLHVTRPYKSSDEALLEAERIIRTRFAGAAISICDKQ